MSALALALDGLVSACNLAPSTEPDDGIDAPRVEFEPIAKQASAAFPSLGLYANIDPVGEVMGEPGVADAIDDISDISRDLADVLWYFDQGRIETAIWEFRFGFQTHWGAHLFDLRRYLHHRLNY